MLFLLLGRRRREQSRKKKREKPRFWVRDIFRQREQYGKCSNSAGTETDDRESYFRCVYILFLLAGYLSCTVILFSCQLVSVD